MAKSVTCRSVGNTVYVHDENGNQVDILSFPQSVSAQSFGNGISVTCGTMCYTYMLEDGRLRQTGMHFVG